ncbi:T9SS type B sorting domain-containing protein [Winogradskyella undariae]|uniref:T9SS type B sorting domain-containing protein n=1 Tax=Winogradskyella undariae TaxID=1285465 RepID=UPI00156B5429|nr:T9SS type B sorting domain-containing protein [Winogradskyella undariae]NRR90288.1 T9SS type B sorting domain-containing protein [Winogradskyella undariae]
MRYLLVVFTLFSTLTYGQLSNKHWFPPLHSRGITTSLDHYVYLSTPEPVPFQVVVTNGNGVAVPGSPFTISQNNPVYFLVGNAQPSLMLVERVDLNAPSGDSGLIFEGPNEFYVTFKIVNANHGEIIVSKGRGGIGTDFRLGSVPQTADDTFARRNFVSSFMATENGTTVTVSDYDTGVTFTTATGTTDVSSQTFSLDAGESVVLSGYSDVPENLTGFIGARLLSNKPIAVNTGNILGGVSDAFSDINLDQIVSVEQIGNEYIFIKGNGSGNSELPLIIATQDNTEVYINESTTPYTTLANAGDYVTIPPTFYQGTENENMRVLTDKPVYAYQILAGVTADRSTGLNFIPPISCSFPSVVDLIPSVNKLNPTSSATYPTDLFVLTTVDSYIYINGGLTTALPEPVLGNPNWVTYRITGYTGDVKAEATGPMSIGVFGSTGTIGYAGHYSGFKDQPIVNPVEVCPEDTVNLFNAIIGDDVLAGGTWSPVLASGTDVFDASLDATGVYTYTFSQSCGDTVIFVHVDPLSVPILTSVEGNGPICFGVDAIFTLEGTPEGIVSYSINNGAVETVNLDATGNATINLGAAATEQVITLSEIALSSSICATELNEVETIVINDVPELTAITSEVSICENEDAIFNLEGTPDALVTYSINSGANETILLDSSGNAIINLDAVTFDQTIEVSQIEITSSGCFVVLTETQTISVRPIPTLTSLTNSGAICENEDAIFTLNGTPNSTVTYTINGGAVQTALLDATGNGTVILTGVFEDQVIELIDISASSTFDCITSLSEIQTVTVISIPEIVIEGGSNCADPDTGLLTQSVLLDSGMQGDLSNYDFSWYFNNSLIPGATSSTYNADEIGDYYVSVFNTVVNCDKTSNTVSVDEIDEATDFTYTVSNAFSDNPTIVVTVVDGDGTFLYQLDDLDYQSSNTFTNVSPGFHDVTVIDEEGCTYLMKEVLVIDYPVFFTPNMDGDNDFWNIYSLRDQPNAKIYIYNRYGKFIKFLTPTEVGWDGTYNSKALPTSDYWFKVEFVENQKIRIFKAHFSLKR